MESNILAFAGGMIGLLFLFLGVAIWFDNKRGVRRRELEHVERIKAIECGYPLPDEDSARHKMLGAIGVLVPAASLTAAAWATQLILAREDYIAPRWLLAVVWGVAGLVALVVGAVAAAGLRPRKVVWPRPAGEPNRAAGVSAELSSGQR
jgi:hypothetical protein